MIDSLDSFHTADSIWAIWGVNSHQDFVDKFMVVGKFHPNVPEEIVNEYKIVERLLCYSFYSYKLFDEAFSKVTRIFESAVKLRLTQLGIAVKDEYEPLNNRLKKLENYTSPGLFKEWDKARKARNIFAHPTGGQQFGIIVHISFLQMVNILNTLFLDKEVIDKNEAVLERMKTETKSFNNGLFKLEIDDRAYLVWSIIPYSCFYDTDKLKSFWVFHPVFTSFPQTTDKLDFILPICLRLKDVSYSEKEIIAINLENNKPIRVRLTDKKENRDMLATHEELVDTSDSEVQEIYLNFLDTELANEIVKFLYHECWN